MKSSSVQMPAVPGFRASGISCGIKPNGQKDLCLIVSETPASAAGVFTLNQVKAPSVLWNQQALRKSRHFRAILVNSGNANACVGPGGMEDCRTLTGTLGKKLSISQNEVLIAATGIIGVALPAGKIIKGIPKLAQSLSIHSWKDAAESIMTTDLVAKTAVLNYTQGSRKIVIGGIAKGSGMIHPNMATMLAFITTNAAIAPAHLHKALKEANEPSFNSITVDGDMSTNDTVLVLANGKAENKPIRPNTAAYKNFVKALTEVCKNLAIQIVKDGEGATKFVTIRVERAKNRVQAKKIAFAVANSSLVKTALFGEDPNWGRILCAAGYAGVSFNPDKVAITLNGAQLFKHGTPAPGSRAALIKKMKQKSLLIKLDLGDGKQSAEIYTCDLSYDYIKINTEYT